VRAFSARHDVRSRTRSDVHDALLFTLSQEKEVVAFRELGEVAAAVIIMMTRTKSALRSQKAHLDNE
jgi:hypothetical protein